MTTTQASDLVRGRLRLSARQLGDLAELLDGSRQDPDAAARELVETGLLGADGALTDVLRAAAAAAASARAQVAVTRLARHRKVRLGITWGEAGIVVMRAVPADEVGDVVVQSPTRLARTVWRVLQLAPRPFLPDRSAMEVDAEALLAPFADREAGWTRTLGVDPATMVLDRLDVVADPRRPPATWAVLDARAQGLWEVSAPEAGGQMTLTPMSAAAAYAAIAVLQPVPEVR